MNTKLLFYFLKYDYRHGPLLYCPTHCPLPYWETPSPALASSFQNKRGAEPLWSLISHAVQVDRHLSKSQKVAYSSSGGREMEGVVEEKRVKKEGMRGKEKKERKKSKNIKKWKWGMGCRREEREGKKGGRGGMWNQRGLMEHMVTWVFIDGWIQSERKEWSRFIRLYSSNRDHVPRNTGYHEELQWNHIEANLPQVSNKQSTY